MHLQPTPAQCYQVHQFFTIMSQNSSKFSHCVLLPLHSVSFDDFLSGLIVNSLHGIFVIKVFGVLPEIIIIEYQIVRMILSFKACI